MYAFKALIASQSRAMRGSKARTRRINGSETSRHIARQREVKRDRRPESARMPGRIRCRRDGVVRLKVDVQPRVGAARNPNGRSATCNGGKCRETRRTARRWRCSRDVLAPDGNLVIAEKCAEAKRRVAAQAKPSARAKRSDRKVPRARTKRMRRKLRG